MALRGFCISTLSASEVDISDSVHEKKTNLGGKSAFKDMNRKSTINQTLYFVCFPSTSLKKKPYEKHKFTSALSFLFNATRI